MDSPRAKLTQCEPPNYGATRTRGSTPSSSSEKQHYADTSSTRSLSTCSSDDTRVDLEPQAPRKRTCSCHLDHVFQWALKILGVAAAIVFGVWAPVSYRLQAEGNRSGDESMAKLVGAVGELVRRVEGLEKWRALEVCGGEGFRTISACQSLASSLDIASLVKDLGLPDPHTSVSSHDISYTTSPVTTPPVPASTLSHVPSITISTAINPEPSSHLSASHSAFPTRQTHRAVPPAHSHGPDSGPAEVRASVGLSSDYFPVVFLLGVPLSALIITFLRIRQKRRGYLSGGMFDGD